MNRREALEIISNSMYASYEELFDGLPEGSNADWGYDEQLVLEIAEAVLRWKSRLNRIKDPYVVWYFDGSRWFKITEEKYQEQAYKDWYSLTKGGKEKSKATEPTYYFLGPADLVLSERHDPEELKEEDDFSINYLLSKSFG